MELTGRSLGHYLVAEEISRGGMGVVYRATDTHLNRDVALKVLPQEVTSDDEVRRRFLREAQAASALEHPHIAVIHGADEVDGIAYIAMELIRGEKLSDLLTRQRLPAARSLELAAEIAAGLARAHEKGIVHRDLKPANVMVTDEGHAKIIDFGIAKLIEVSAGAGAQTQTGRDTGVGVVLGTMTYMSPEQARGEIVDHRSDIFSFGILLHEMLAGQPPFRGKTGIETVSAILHEAAPRLPSLGPTVIAEAGADIQRMVDKCLAKDPADRYQGMKDAVVDIRAARRRLDTGPQAAAAPAPSAPMRVPTWGWLAAAVAVVAIAGVVLFTRTGGSANDAPAAGGSGKPSVAVLYFDNTTGDKELDWMRTGITEMVVTDLSQSQGIEVVGTDRLYGILAELKRQDDRMLSPEAVSEVAARTGVTNIVVGSYVRSGDAIRINVRLQEAKTGRIISSERVDGTSTSALFSMIDDLSSRIRSKFEGLRAEAALLTAPGARPSANGNRGVEEVTTTSIEAYRFYAEGLGHTNRRSDTEAIALFEKAVAIDPMFAMAYGKMAVVEGNRGNFDRRNQYSAKAFSLADRLTPRDRAYIEGVHYGNSPADGAKAMTAYERCLAIDPSYESCRNNLGLAYNGLERYEEAIGQFEPLIQAGTTMLQPYANVAVGYRALGQPEKALAVVDTFARRNPESAVAQSLLGTALIGVGRLDDAIRALEKARLLDPIDSAAENSSGLIHLLREDWKGASAVAGNLANGPTEAHRWVGAQVYVALDGLVGKSAEALTWAERAAAAYKVRGQRSSVGHQFVGLTLLARGDHAAAAAAFTKAVADAKGTPEEPTALLYRAWALSGARRPAEADAAVAALVSKTNPMAIVRDGRLANVARGLVALGRSDAAAAIKPLQDAATALPSRGTGPNGRSWHLPVWSSLGQALLEAGRAGEARPWFEKVAGSGYERARQPIDFVRSFYFLGRIYEQQGDTAKSREAYRRFVGYWKDGDLDRERIAEAQKKIGS